jgi:hypothetical protein
MLTLTVIVFETPPEDAVTVTLDIPFCDKATPTQPISPAELIASNANVR